MSDIDATPSGPMPGSPRNEQRMVAARLSPEELERARQTYRGAMEAARGWRAFTKDTRHHDQTYWSLLVTLFIEPGLNRTSLLERVIEHAGVSRSTAERAIREGKEAGYITDRPVGREVRYALSERLEAHCLAYFHDFLDYRPLIDRLHRERAGS